MVQRLTFVALVSSSLGLLACGGDDSGADGGQTSTDGGSETDGSSTGDEGEHPFPDLPTSSVAESDFIGVVAPAWCEFQAYCERLDEDYPTVAACTEYWTDKLGTYTQISQGMGLTYDATCVDRLFRAMEARLCGENLSWYYQDEFRCKCDVYNGSVAEGQPCNHVGIDGFTECAQGLRCEGTCESSCHEFAGPGQTCDPMGVVDDVCITPVGVCMNGICEPFPTVGEPCFTSLCYGEDAYCDIDADLCVANKPRGATCEYGPECDTRNCQNGVCVSDYWPSPFYFY